MKDKQFTKEQAAMMLQCFCGLLMLAIPATWAQIINRFIGAFVILFAVVMLYREIIKNNSSKIKEKIVSFIIVIMFVIAGFVLLLNNGTGGAIICTMSGILIVIWGGSDLIKAKEMEVIYSSVVFAVIGTIVIFVSYKTAASITKICGIFICYYSLSSFLRDKFG